MLKKPITEVTTTIIYHGDGVVELLDTYKDVALAVQKMCLGMYDTTIRVDVDPSTHHNQPLLWTMTITSSKGRRTMQVIQRTPLGAISFRS